MERAIGRANPLTPASTPYWSSRLPAYAEMLSAYHTAHATELQAMIADLPLQHGADVLDLACGSGTYSCWLAAQVGPRGSVVAVDIDPAFLAVAEAVVAAAGMSERVHMRRADAADLPFADNSFDLAWCAQSMFTLPEPAAALRELWRVVRPGGTVAVFENDTLHQLILPWPVDLELAVRKAQLRSFRSDTTTAEQFFIGRDLRTYLSRAGFVDCRILAYTTVRQAPLEANERTFLQWYLQDVAERACAFLEPALRTRFQRLIDPASPTYLLDQPDFTVTYLDLLALGRKQS
ncbi:MAG: methyltransferase domain-containing protein [Oscillochloris sp.]|nr:methyltransferase domain-containing protein [Oscillochloris sp.]